MNILNKITSFISAIFITISGLLVPANKLPPSPTLTPIVISPSPSPQVIQPSQKALKLAADLYVLSGKKGQDEMMKKYNVTDPTTTIKLMAFEMDNDPAKMALIEAGLQKYNREQNNATNYDSSNYDTPTVITQPQTNNSSDWYEQWKAENKQRCQDEINKYTTCMTEYNSKMIEYNSCETEKLTNAYKYCYKPMNLCGLKPFCSY
ncbi:MAG: hypothetical protein UV61_C0001G0088 [Candidatus Gottesmanbacteria bacterium GW2011_GWB1_43_11]|uniref:Uncharacterized protein n=1 Tax=Candidatus Gottesmanbacteria bacterium GW2011_GWB1_43_11 TaxID=1618446 RepID=A0A0G1EXK6_9BACT|nr:MAG: hypothetical protein UV04_C0004G0030 [Candidatus Gottesmanbacteria bacterium GW2011_GWA2_42_16]KKS56053.1 MAG: hypothetical protein UV17_C0003G0025 [Candidatus Gottesmanbacteria bacterium GW2011_GWA1_42_26]KKS81635.1 MAG: hypothetical protein UV55_C0011G0029 [Candidatus Gottesmanbacteria bacterium GW2011_GWC1_43_10]KKS87681.1 MAG: hypothetical protein UV61_C0001G0088 [Candidatus Gottesmanbacteria bacterium GW2011_GWB1_43_11]OGG07496.1 MAG: hypothetical protein A2699_00420 [Candidatus Go